LFALLVKWKQLTITRCPISSV